MSQIVHVVLIDGTKFAVSDFRFGGTIKSIEYLANREVLMVSLNTNKEVCIPYHSVLFYVIEE